MVFDLKTKVTRFVTDAREASILEAGPHKGKLVVNKHKYYKDQDGSHDYYFVIDDNGREIKELGENLPY